MGRTIAAVAAACITLLTIGLPRALAADVAMSATSWRATLVGPTLHGGATTLLQSDGLGSVNVKVTGVTAGQDATANVTEARCGSSGRSLVSFPLQVHGDGTATGKLTLTAAQVAAYAAARRSGVLFSIRVATAGGEACGNQIGAPSVGTSRLADTKRGVYTYDLRAPSVGGLEPAVANRINDQVSAATRATIEQFVAAATGTGGESTARQTFVVTLALPSLLSVVEHYVPEVVGAPHGDEQFLTFTFDLATGRRILLADLFRRDSAWVTALSQASIARLRPTLGAFGGALAGPIADNFGAWSLAPGGLRITFAQAQGFAVPITTITIPWSALADVLAPDSPVARLFPRS